MSDLHPEGRGLEPVSVTFFMARKCPVSRARKMSGMCKDHVNIHVTHADQADSASSKL